MQYAWIRTIVITTCCLSSIAWSQISDEERKFREALKDTPFADAPYRPGMAIPEVPNKQEQRNTDRFVEAVDQLGGITFIDLISRYDLYAELGVTEKQRQRLEKVLIPNPVSLRNAIQSDASKLSEAAFSGVLARFRKVAAAAYTRSNDQVEDILTVSRMKRLRQIACRFYLFKYTKPSFAVAYHEEKLSSDEHNAILQTLIVARNQNHALRRKLSLWFSAKAIQDVTRKPVIPNLGDLVQSAATGQAINDRVAQILEETTGMGAAKPPTQSPNPRRK